MAHKLMAYNGISLKMEEKAFRPFITIQPCHST